MTIHSSQFQLLSKAMEFAQQNHRVISSNLANVNTPNYQARELSFDKFLQSMDGNTSSADDPKIYGTRLVEGLLARTDGNNVDLDREIANLKQNDLMFQTLAQLIGSKLDLMKTAIRG